MDNFHIDQASMQGAKHEIERKSYDERQQIDELSRIRHSCAHVLATAVLRLWPEAKLDIGPPTEEGFYYDFDLEHRFTPDDFENIESEMKKVAKENQVFEKTEKTREEAKEYLNLLIDAKILHLTFNSAVEHLNKFWQNIDKWWLSERVQENIKIFCEKYAKYEKNIDIKLIKLLKSNLND